MSEGSCHAGSVSDTAGGALTPCPAPKAGPAGSAGTVEGLGPPEEGATQQEPEGPADEEGATEDLSEVLGVSPGGKRRGLRWETRARADGEGV